jgi:hypothetical protein
MPNFINQDITTAGVSLIAKSIAGEQIIFTRIAIGDGSLPTGSDPAEMPALINQITSMPITKCKVSGPDSVVVGAVFDNAATQTGFYYRELGLYAQDPDVGEILYCYGNAGQYSEYIPATTDGSVEKSIDIITYIGGATDVTAVIASGIYATQADLQDAIEAAGSTAPSNAIPAMDGSSGSPGSSIEFSRGDHKHPSDTSRAALVHTHAATDITTGTMAVARLPSASTAQSGIVQLSNVLTDSSTTKALTARQGVVIAAAIDSLRPYNLLVPTNASTSISSTDMGGINVSCIIDNTPGQFLLGVRVDDTSAPTSIAWICNTTADYTQNNATPVTTYGWNSSNLPKAVISALSNPQHYLAVAELSIISEAGVQKKTISVATNIDAESPIRYYVSVY